MTISSIENYPILSQNVSSRGRLGYKSRCSSEGHGGCLSRVALVVFVISTIIVAVLLMVAFLTPGFHGGIQVILWGCAGGAGALSVIALITYVVAVDCISSKPKMGLEKLEKEEVILVSITEDELNAIVTTEFESKRNKLKQKNDSLAQHIFKLIEEVKGLAVQEANINELHKQSVLDGLRGIAKRLLSDKQAGLQLAVNRFEVLMVEVKKLAIFQLTQQDISCILFPSFIDKIDLLGQTDPHLKKSIQQCLTPVLELVKGEYRITHQDKEIIVQALISIDEKLPCLTTELQLVPKKEGLENTVVELTTTIMASNHFDMIQSEELDFLGDFANELRTLEQMSKGLQQRVDGLLQLVNTWITERVLLSKERKQELLLAMQNLGEGLVVHSAERVYQAICQIEMILGVVKEVLSDLAKKNLLIMTAKDLAWRQDVSELLEKGNTLRVGLGIQVGSQGHIIIQRLLIMLNEALEKEDFQAVREVITSLRQEIKKGAFQIQQ